jgi:hypothetical protein
VVSVRNLCVAATGRWQRVAKPVGERESLDLAEREPIAERE